MRTRDNARSTDAENDRTSARPPAAAGGERLPGLVALQRATGNAAVVEILRRAGHPSAQEVHEHDAGCGHEQASVQSAEAPVQRRSAVHDVLNTGGRALDDDVRVDMEARLGADFSDVRVHTDAAAKASAAEIGARAYTSGNHIVMGDGGTDRHTLAHELTHVIQQRRGPVAGTDNGAGLRVSDPSDRFEREADANARRAMSKQVPSADAVQRSSVGPAGARAADHRAPGGDTAVQRAPVVQREELDIQDGSEEPTTIRSASDLLVWLVGHPTRPAPRNWAEPAVLQRVLARLEQVDGPVTRDAVWNAVREVLARQEAQQAGDSESESESDSSSEGGGFFRGPTARRDDDSSSSDEEEESDTTSTASSESLSGEHWDEGEWGSDEYGVSAPLEFRREMPADELAERRRAQTESLSGYRLVGFHGTQIESLGSLVTDGPDLTRIGQANGIGKGAGFYVAPVVAPTGVKAPGTTTAKSNAKTWGKFLVAVYVKNDVDVERYVGDSDSEDGVGFESAESAGSGPAMVFHGSDELVIPAELFDKIKLVRNADDMAMTSDPGHTAVAYEDGVSQHSKRSKK
ncbi:DUF4157 domain-containing protein [Streptomyces sp. NPDC093060]|uniref:eCIS core domain-containing protein n=1 Tax=Streptomyces sp. NPDC093060 TaxID=3366019 RepID=UPI003824D7F9